MELTKSELEQARIAADRIVKNYRNWVAAPKEGSFEFGAWLVGSILNECSKRKVRHHVKDAWKQHLRTTVIEKLAPRPDKTWFG